MGKFDGILICTDLDGTLLNSEHKVSRENVDAIEYFKSEGGLFTFVTGRMPYYVGTTFDCVKPNIPYGCVNGGGVYDHVKNEYIWTHSMDREVLELIEHIDKVFPSVGIQVATFEHTYFCKDNSTMRWFRELTGVENLVCHYTQIREPMAKIIFGTDDGGEFEMMKRELHSHKLAEKFDFICSTPTLYEVLPKGMGKGVAIQKMCEILGFDINKTLSIGDYDNDVSMFKATKIGVAVANASPRALEAADFVTVSNNEHAVARLIYDLESGKYKV